ncbi:MAG: hypothetical protein R6V67_03930 [Spirochaetia bacterium]
MKNDDGKNASAEDPLSIVQKAAKGVGLPEDNAHREDYAHRKEDRGLYPICSRKI